MSIELRDEAVESARQLLEHELPDVDIETGETGEGKWFLLPASSDADYRWSFWFYPSGERHIYAKLDARRSENESRDYVLWYHPFELDGFNRSSASLGEAFEREVRLILHSTTRITQKRHLLNWEIQLERAHESGWQLVYRFFALRAGWETPRIEGDSATYQAPAFK